MSELAAKRKTDRVGSAKTGRKLFQRILKNRWLYLLALPGIAYYILFKYVPMWGLLIAFSSFNSFFLSSKSSF